MKFENKSIQSLQITNERAKMWEYSIPKERHLKFKENPAELFSLTIGILGDFVASINKSGDTTSTPEIIEQLQLSAQQFDYYFQAQLNASLDSYLLLLASATYYLSNLPGNASVLARKIKDKDLEIQGDGLENLILWLLQGDIGSSFEVSSGQFKEIINNITADLKEFFQSGDHIEKLVKLSDQLRKLVYEIGSPRQLLLGEVVSAIVRKKLRDSPWTALPLYSKLKKELWASSLLKKSSIKELWPAQHLLGKSDIFQGKSAVVQLPTSAGKTKAIELILRSSYLAKRTNLAIIIAPFRALCHEINDDLSVAFKNESIQIDEFTDILQEDYDSTGNLSQYKILISTPEKFIYVLRHNPKIVQSIGLIIFDEGHQFDNEGRGITYEFLVTSLMMLVSSDTQKILISAVLKNGKDIEEWMNGKDNCNVVNDESITTTFRSIAAIKWANDSGSINFLNSSDMNKTKFHIPKVINSFQLLRKGGGTKGAIIPSRKASDRSTDLSICLGLNLVHHGGVAIFCGLKSSVNKVCKRLNDILELSEKFTDAYKSSQLDEIVKLADLYKENLGMDSTAYLSANNAIFAHHGNIPSGLRMAVEYSMRKEYIRFVVCTSTLAQGINLPIRYLIIKSTYVAGKQIAVRDFQNLIGRAGRSGMHTEGTILFTDPSQLDRNNEFKRRATLKLLNPSNSEPCNSRLLLLLEPLQNSYGNTFIDLNPIILAKNYIENPKLSIIISKTVKDEELNRLPRLDIENGIASRIKIICAVESFLLSHLADNDGNSTKEDTIHLVEQTFAYHIANESQKKELIKIFLVLSENISASLPEHRRRIAYGKTLYGVHDSKCIESWISKNLDHLLSANDSIELLDLIWPLFTNLIHEGIFLKLSKPELRRRLANEWILGKSFCDLLEIIKKEEIKKSQGSKENSVIIEDVVDLCEQTLSYHGSLIIGALCQLLSLQNQTGIESLITKLQFLQKQIKYGLPSKSTIAVYELGFSDRVISQDIVTNLELSESSNSYLVKKLIENRDKSNKLLAKYPKYFENQLKEIIESTPS